jgi:hypothetical protein
MIHLRLSFWILMLLLVAGPVRAQHSCITLDYVEYISPTCPQGSDGGLIIHAKGLGTPYQYSIDGGATYTASNRFTALPTGQYQVRIRPTRSLTCFNTRPLDTMLAVPDITVSANRRSEIWHFQDREGLSFRDGRPKAIPGYTPDASNSASTLCDVHGKLLLSSDGQTVWNGRSTTNVGQTLVNGTGLMGNINSYNPVLILPQPGSSRYAYLFTTDGTHSLRRGVGFRYNRIDLAADGGRGRVIAKNVFLADSIADRMVATPHANGKDWWIVVRAAIGSEYRAYLLTDAGISAQPVRSPVGISIDCYIFDPFEPGCRVGGGVWVTR